MGALALVVIAAGYILLPFWTAFSIREAVRRGDVAYLERTVEWDSVRETLRQSLHATALVLPDPAALEANLTVDDRGLWQRLKDGVKSLAGKPVIDSLVDRYVTPAGLPQLYAYRQTYRERVKGETDEALALPLGTRIARAWARVKRAEFHSPTRFEIEMQDKFTPTRSYVGMLELKGDGWKLTELRVRSSATVAPLATAQ
jgi:hypothetical protein